MINTSRLQSWMRANPVTFTLVLVCVLVWLVEIIAGPTFVSRGLFSPSLMFREPWRILTAVFMHNWTDPLHLLFNMIALVFSGPIFERIFGTAKYLTIFLVSGIFGNLFLGFWHLILGTNSVVLSLGASGAVFSLFGGLLVLHKQLGANARGIYMTVGLNLLISFYINTLAWQAHVGGLIAGIVITWVFVKYFKQRYI